VADCKLATTENMAYVHQRQGRFLTVLPRTRSEDGAFRDLLHSGQVQWRPIHDKRNDEGEIVDRYSVVAGLQASAVAGEAILSLEDGFRGRSRLSQGGQSDSSIMTHVYDA